MIAAGFFRGARVTANGAIETFESHVRENLEKTISRLLTYLCFGRKYILTILRMIYEGIRIKKIERIPSFTRKILKMNPLLGS